MKKPLTFLALTIVFPTFAEAGWCHHSQKLAEEFALDGVRQIEVIAVSGDLEIAGRGGLRRVRAGGVACVQRQYEDRLDEIEIAGERVGDTLRIVAEVPFGDDGEGRIGGLDLVLDVPDNVPLRVTDTSGHLRIEDVAALELTDSSGNIRIERVAGSVHIDRDSSGDIDIRDSGEVVIDSDSSGDIDIVRSASVTIGRDSSGSIRARDVRGDVTIGRDSSGSIEVADVAGSFSVDQDTSGGIRYRGVGGAVRVPDDD